MRPNRNCIDVMAVCTSARVLIPALISSTFANFINAAAISSFPFIGKGASVERHDALFTPMSRSSSHRPNKTSLICRVLSRVACRLREISRRSSSSFAEDTLPSDAAADAFASCRSRTSTRSRSAHFCSRARASELCSAATSASACAARASHSAFVGCCAAGRRLPAESAARSCVLCASARRSLASSASRRCSASESLAPRQDSKTALCASHRRRASTRHFRFTI